MKPISLGHVNDSEAYFTGEVQLVNYLVATGKPVGLILNFGESGPPASPACPEAVRSGELAMAGRLKLSLGQGSELNDQQDEKTIKSILLSCQR